MLRNLYKSDHSSRQLPYDPFMGLHLSEKTRIASEAMLQQPSKWVDEQKQLQKKMNKKKSSNQK